MNILQELNILQVVSVSTQASLWSAEANDMSHLKIFPIRMFSKFITISRSTGNTLSQIVSGSTQTHCDPLPSPINRIFDSAKSVGGTVLHGFTSCLISKLLISILIILLQWAYWGVKRDILNSKGIATPYSMTVLILRPLGLLVKTAPPRQSTLGVLRRTHLS